MSQTPSDTVEFSRPVEIHRLGDSELVHKISATAEERAALARRFDILAVDRLEAKVTLRRTRAGLKLAGRLDADVVQACVATTEPVPATVSHDFTVIYGDISEGADVEIDLDENDPVEPMPEGALDIGEAVAQELALALDPYPRAPGAAIDQRWIEPESEAKPVNPFAALAKLTKGKS
jgi:uncharacterized metal-binding protein YceD (DUF177 family)